ncbi:Ig-like domain-containing protein [Pseudomonas chlororaphis]|nr:Ig-like domain-containing protein [Pseudomonas chlororaphis]
MSRKIKKAALLPPTAPTVDEAPDNILDPETLPPRGATVRIEPDGLVYRDEVYLFLGQDDSYYDFKRVGANGPGDGVTFQVPAREFEPYIGGDMLVYYKVTFYTGEALVPSDPLELSVIGGFDTPMRLDLSEHDYVAVAEKPPLALPSFTQLSREANWGTAPYEYFSSDRNIARVDERGNVTVTGNGLCTITATDNRQESRSYPLTVAGIKQVDFLSPSADWQGMRNVCSAAGLSPISLVQIKRLWTLYNAGSGGVANYLGWLNYSFWTGDTLGAGTAWAYDLNGAEVNGNASSHDIGTYLQVVGISQG